MFLVRRRGHQRVRGLAPRRERPSPCSHSVFFVGVVVSLPCFLITSMLKAGSDGCCCRLEYCCCPLLFHWENPATATTITTIIASTRYTATSRHHIVKTHAPPPPPPPPSPSVVQYDTYTAPAKSHNAATVVIYKYIFLLCTPDFLRCDFLRSNQYLRSFTSNRTKYFHF